MPNIDLQYDTDYDILFDEEAEDLAIGPADQDNIQDILEIIPGELRYAPTVGCAIITRLNGTIEQSDIAGINSQLATDGYKNVTIQYANGQLSIINNSPTQ